MIKNLFLIDIELLKKKQFIFFTILLVSLFIPAVFAKNQLIELKNVQIQYDAKKTKVLLELSHQTQYKYFFLEKPSRLVIDLNHTKKASLLKKNFKSNLIKKIRFGVHDQDKLRMVIELNDKIENESIKFTKDNILAIELYSKLKENKFHFIHSRSQSKVVVIAVDPGHGGQDSGAIGYKGKDEKNITIAIGKRLVTLFDNTPGIKGILTRKGDYYIHLAERRKIARDHQADFFISIHADGFTDHRASGASVFALSNRGATSATAKWLAESENSSDKIGGDEGVALNDKSRELVGILLDLSMKATLVSSLSMGHYILNSLSTMTKLHQKKVEQAGFVVLKSPDIPSVLVETGFITNPDEEKKLSNPDYQQKIANAIYKGMLKFLSYSPPKDSLLAKWKKTGELEKKLFSAYSPQYYTVKQGDTLSEIALLLKKSINQLKKINRIKNDQLLYVGQKLVIPR